MSHHPDSDESPPLGGVHHSEDELGSLEPGKLADFVILEDDPRRVEPTTISEIGVSETWMNGERVYHA